MWEHLSSCLQSTPQTLGDPRKDTPQEMEERYERVMAAALAAVVAFITNLQQLQPPQQQQGEEQQQQDQQQEEEEDAGSAVAEAGKSGSSSSSTTPAPPGTATGGAGGVVEEVVAKLQVLLEGPGFWKKTLGSKSVLVRRAAYGFVKGLATADTGADGGVGLMGEGALEVAAPAVMGALQVRGGGR